MQDIYGFASYWGQDRLTMLESKYELEGFKHQRPDHVVKSRWAFLKVLECKALLEKHRWFIPNTTRGNNTQLFWDTLAGCLKEGVLPKVYLKNNVLVNLKGVRFDISKFNAYYSMVVKKLIEFKAIKRRDFYTTTFISWETLLK